MSLEPPPRIIDAFINIWRDWLYFFWEFVDEHTGGSSPTPPATGTSWNAHGNTAVSDGDAANFLKVEHGSLWVDGSNSISGFLGDYPSGAEYQGSGSESKMLFIADKGAFRAGKVTGTAWDDAQIGPSSFAAGVDAIASGSDTVTIGTNSINNATNNAVIMGINNEITSSAIFGLCFGHQNYLGPLPAGNAFNTACLGTWLEAQNPGSFVIGKGAFPGAGRLVNNVTNSLMIGMGSTTPTFTLLNGRCAVSTTANVITNPLSTFDIGGSVGFQYTNIGAADEPYFVSANDDELAYIIDTSAFGSGASAYVFNLPEITATSVDRRMYHIVNQHAPGTPGAHDVVITPFPGNFIWQGPNNSPSGTALILARGLSYQLLAAFDGYDAGGGRQPTWWVL